MQSEPQLCNIIVTVSTFMPHFGLPQAFHQNWWAPRGAGGPLRTQLIRDDAQCIVASPNVRILEQLAPVPGAPPGHMKGYILEEFGSGASEARDT